MLHNDARKIKPVWKKPITISWRNKSDKNQMQSQNDGYRNEQSATLTEKNKRQQVDSISSKKQRQCHKTSAITLGKSHCNHRCLWTIILMKLKCWLPLHHTAGREYYIFLDYDNEPKTMQKTLLKQAHCRQSTLKLQTTGTK